MFICYKLCNLCQKIFLLIYYSDAFLTVPKELAGVVSYVHFFFSLHLQVPGLCPSGVLKHHEVLILPSQGLQILLPFPTDCVSVVNLVIHDSPCLYVQWNLQVL